MLPRKVRRVAVRLARGRGGREPLPGARAAKRLARPGRKEQERGLVEGLVLAGDLEADRAAEKLPRQNPQAQEPGLAAGLDLAGDMYSGRQVEEALVERFPAAHCPLKSKPLRAERELAVGAEVEWAFPV